MPGNGIQNQRSDWRLMYTLVCIAKSRVQGASKGFPHHPSDDEIADAVNEMNELLMEEGGVLEYRLERDYEYRT